MHPTAFWSFPWPDARLYCTVIGVVLGIYFIKALADAIVRSTLAYESEAPGLRTFCRVAAGYLWSTTVFWGAALGFIAAYKG